VVDRFYTDTAPSAERATTDFQRTGGAEVERETATWVHWFNTNRLHSSLGYTLPTATVTPSHHQRWHNQRSSSGSGRFIEPIFSA
jgi:hypothetical protein